ncbi:hypothetical protein L249_3879 [Ophiocordyceps polyrhachis-furcata BCC 54312]|uniref:Uncharacterized protein n=1 Tax=Ophiocordyceps polyrhachis-furcata BCC 54312 TaxID=1330021 RepID=A0A367L635_9HYPO|nr:hypothetical protein L249_3879 [Ophiocordyceps polyrhachis-furcata BCC 54312]
MDPKTIFFYPGKRRDEWRQCLLQSSVGGSGQLYEADVEMCISTAYIRTVRTILYEYRQRSLAAKCTEAALPALHKRPPL